MKSNIDETIEIQGNVIDHLAMNEIKYGIKSMSKVISTLPLLIAPLLMVTYKIQE